MILLLILSLYGLLILIIIIIILIINRFNSIQNLGLFTAHMILKMAILSIIFCLLVVSGRINCSFI